MSEVLSQNWWSVLWPRPILLMLVAFFGLLSVVNSLLATIPGVASRQSNSRWWLITLSGVAWGLIGVLTLVWSDINPFVLLVIIAAWALVTCAIEMAAAITLHKFIVLEWLMIANGTLSMLFIWLLILFRGPEALNVVWLIGIYTIALGILQIGLSLKLRDIKYRFSVSKAKYQ